MSFSIKQFITGIGLKPVSADPSNPTQGQLQYADGTVRAEGLWRYDGTAWQQVGSGAGSYDIFFQENLETNTSSNFTSGQNAAPDAAGTGTLGGALANEESSQISGDRSLKYTMNATAGSSDNDFFINDTDIALETKQKGQFVGVTFYYTYSGDDDDIRFFVLDQDDNELTQSDEYIKSASGATRFSTSVFIPSSDTAIRYGFQVVTGNSSKVFIVDDIEFSTNPFVYKNLADENIYSARIQNNGSASVISQSGSWIDSVTFNATGSVTVDYSSLGLTVIPAFSFGGDTLTGDGAIYYENESTTSVTIRTADAGAASNKNFDLILKKQGADYQAPAEHVVTPAKAVVETYRAERCTGYGSTNTRIPVFQDTIVDTSNDLFSVENTAANGLSITMLRDVIVDFSYSAMFSASIGFGVSLNSNQLSTNIDSITGEVIAYGSTAAANKGQSISFHGKLSKGDVIRPHTNGTSFNTSTITNQFIFKARAAEAEFLAAVPMNYFQKKNLASDKTSSQALTDLAFNNLVVGKTYRLLCSMDMDSNTNTTSFSIEMTHDSSIILKVQAEQYSAITEEHVLSNSVIFTATASTITAQFNRSAGTLRAAQTYAILEELNYTKETTRFT